MATEGTRYEILILPEDVPQEIRTPGRPGRPRKFAHEMSTYCVMLPAESLRRIDLGARIGVDRPAILRAIIRQAMEANPEVVTGWARQRLSD